jgi:hypothetical protein
MNDSPFSKFERSPIRWWIPGPGHDESLRSIVERAEKLYGTFGDAFRQCLPERPTPSSDIPEGLSALSGRHLCVLADMIGVSPVSLFAHRLPDHPLLLHESERRAYCPKCWKDDRSTGRPFAFRRSWARVFSVTCDVHGVPLHWAPHSFPVQPERASLQPKRKDSVRILMAITQLAHCMEAVLQGSESWPNHWRGDAKIARAILMRAVVNLCLMTESPPYENVVVPDDLQRFISTPRRRLEPLNGAPWEVVRALGPPAWRRAALLIVARRLMPGMARSVLIERDLVADAIRMSDEQWDRTRPEMRTMRRLRRYGAALRKVCCLFTCEYGLTT